MNKHQTSNVMKTLRLLTLFSLGLWFQPALKADVVVLQSGTVITGNVLQQDANGVLIQMETGTFRYPLSLIKEVKKEAAAAHHVSNNGKTIPDWAQIVSLLANNNWADNLKQVPATVINYGMFKNIPYVSFRCAAGGYEVNIYGDLNNPVAVQVGAMNYLRNDTNARSNCVNFVCSILSSADARKKVRALSLNQKMLLENAGMTFETILPGETGSYGGWWVLVYNQNDLASAQASEAELQSLTQTPSAAPQPSPNPNYAAPVAAAPPAATTQPNQSASSSQSDQSAPAPATTTTYQSTDYYNAHPAAWTDAEMAAARPGTPATTPAATAARVDAATPAAPAVYPRTYAKTPGGYDRNRR